MADFGYISLFLAFVVSLYSAIAYVVGQRRKNLALFASARNGLLLVCGLVTLAVLSLLYSLLTHDFQITYVAEHSNRSLAPAYLIAALWAGGNGSVLFWGWIVSIMGAVLALQTRRTGKDLVPYTSAVVAVTMAFFTLTLIAVGNPFVKLGFTPADGAGLNPLLQNPGMLFHPPLLLAGYAGMTIPFAFCVAALVNRRFDAAWLTGMRRWALIAWLFLGAGNLLGAWWAYNELNWGGYWGWDPVENSSLMPWLVCTAFLHSTMMEKRRGMFKVWSASLIIVAFVLPLLGIFLERSTLASPNHGFGGDPVQEKVGWFFFWFALLALVGAFGLLFHRRDILKSDSQIESLVSRESTFLLNNVLFAFSTLAIFVGTFLPVILNNITGSQISVGPGFFNGVNGPIFLGIVLLAGICATIGWRQASMQNLMRNLLWPAVGSVIAAAVIFIFGVREWVGVVGFMIGGFLLLTIIYEWVRGARARSRSQHENWAKGFVGLIASNRPRYGGLLVHFGIALLAIGVVGSSLFSVTKEVSLKPGDTETLKQYSFVYDRFEPSVVDGKDTLTAVISVSASGKPIGQLRPYIREIPKVAIRSTLVDDIWVNMTNPDVDGQAVFKMNLNPLVSWMWIGSYILVLGGLLAFWPESKSDTGKSN